MSVQSPVNELPCDAAPLAGVSAKDSQAPDLAWSTSHAISERVALYGFFALMTYAIVRSIFQALWRPFWFDEVLTWAVVRQPSLSAIWHVLARAADGQPPMFYIIERFFGHLIRNEQIAFRLPSLAAFCGTLVCVFLWVRKYSGGFVALLCATAILVSPLFDYAVEARPYALVAACIAFALFCYERADKRPWAILLGASLMFAQSLHYYAIFPITSFGIAELVYLARTRKIRLGVWCAIALSIVPLAICWPLLKSFKAYYGQHFWSQPNSWGLLLTYYMLLRPLFPPFAGATPRTVITGALMLGVLAVALLLGLRAYRNRTDEQPSIQVLAAIAALLALPFTIFLATTLVHGGFTERYTLPTLVGMAVALGYLMRSQRRAVIAIVAVVLVACFAKMEYRFWTLQRGAVWYVNCDVEGIQNLVASVGHPDLPVVVSDSMDMLPLSYYAPSVWKRYVAILDPQHAVSFAGSDSNDLELMIVKDLVPMRADSFEDFSAKHQTFLLYSSSSGAWSSDWWPVYLTSNGYFVKTLRTHGIQSVFLVDLHKRNVVRN